MRLLFNPGSGAGLDALDAGGGVAPATVAPSQTTPGLVQGTPPSGGGQAPPQGGQQSPPEGGGQPQGGQAPPPQGGQPAVPVAQLTPEQITNLVAQTARAVMPQQPQGAQAPATQEEFERMFNIFKPSEQDVVDLLAGGQQAIAALNRIGPALVKQAVTLNAYHVQKLFEDFQKKYDFDGLMTERQQRQREKVETLFYEKHPTLKQHSTLVNAVGAQLMQERFTGTQEEAFKVVHDRVQAILASTGLTPAQPGQGQQPAQPAPNGMATLSKGGQGGAGGGGGAGTVPKVGAAGLAALD